MTLSPIYCNECGAQNVPGAKFCVTCGRVIAVAEPPSAPFESPGTGLLPQDSLLNKRYRIIKLVGTGGMGAVYKAEDTIFGDRPVAVKEMRQSSLGPVEREVATEQFKIEANMLARLQHPSLPRIYEHFLASNRWYLVMDFIDGETLDERLRRTPGRKLPPPEVVEIGIQLCRVLDYLHKRQPPVIFRDIKPSNVMLNQDGHLYLIDFGIARIFKPGQVKDTKAYGSIGYSAPEQFDREQTTGLADIYSLGITLHECLSGSIPARNPFNMPRLEFSGQPALERLAALITQMMALEKDKRPASVEKVRQELESIRDGLKQAVYIPLTAQSAAPPTQYTPQSSPEPGYRAPTEYVAPPPMAATVAVPSFTGGVLRSAPPAAALPRRPASRRNPLAIGRSKVRGMILGVIIYGLLSLIFALLLRQAYSSSSPVYSDIFDVSGGPTWADLILSLIFCIPFYFGARFGPWVGLIVAVIGTLPLDFLANSTPMPVWYWIAGSAALGFVPGLAFFNTHGVYKQASSILLAVLLSLIGIVIWNVLRVIGIFNNVVIDQAAFIPALLTTILVQLVALVPFVVVLIIMQRVTKAS